MNRRGRILFGLVGLAVVGFIIWLAAISQKPAANQAVDKTSPTNAATSSVTTFVHNSTPTLADMTVASTPTNPPAPAAPLPPEGLDITPELARHFGWKLLSTRRPPKLSEQAVTGLVLASINRQGQASLGVTASYGLATNTTYPTPACFGQPNCTPNPNDRFENRPAWVLDVAGLPYMGGGSPCAIPTNTHSLFVVEEETQKVIGGSQTAGAIQVPTPTPSTPRATLATTPLPTPVQVGEKFIFYQDRIDLERVAEPAPLTAEEVIKAVSLQQHPYGRGGFYNGHQLNVNVYYGLYRSTIAADGKPCPEGAVCGTPIPGSYARPIERRAYVIDYGNMPIESGVPCLGDDPTRDRHEIVVLDAISLQRIGGANYDLKLP